MLILGQGKFVGFGGGDGIFLPQLPLDAWVLRSAKLASITLIKTSSTCFGMLKCQVTNCSFSFAENVILSQHLNDNPRKEQVF